MPTRRELLAAMAAVTTLGLRTAWADPAGTTASSVSASASPLPGRTFMPALTGAPFPHASRAAGHDYNGEHFDVAQCYSDSTVGIYVPSHFKPGAATDVIVHFHGWSNHVEQVLQRYELREQLESSGLNAVLVVPQGPKDAKDSGDGKLELDAEGFKRFMQEVGAFLLAQKVVSTSAVGRIVLTMHSGGYGGVGGVLTRGGMNESITDVILFDAAYNYFGAFADWAKGSPERHLLSIFTDDTALGNADLMALLQGVRPYEVFDAASMTLAGLRTRNPTFVFTNSVEHDKLMQQYRWFELFLRTTALARAAA
ncbi:MAG: hypothetical protein JO269_03435 [Burkholderiaceae bacterium]|nr:hypothetical protein [Burkholderiaceae bacterium]